jgi:hypothetical protein
MSSGMKPFWRSRTFWVNFIPFVTSLNDIVITYLQGGTQSKTALAIAILSGINIVLRFITKTHVALFVALFIVGCAGIPQKLDPDKFYKRDLPFCVKDIGCYEGTAVIPKKDYYEFEVAPKGNALVDMLVLDSCHREFTREGNEKSYLDFFAKIFGKKREGYKIHYTVIPGIEDDGDCSVRINTFEKEKGRHAWGIIRIQHEKYQLPALVYCNGEIRKEVGVSICQSKAGMTQQIRFDEAVMIETDKGCSPMRRKASGLYEWEISNGECGYSIRSQSGLVHDLLTVGYTGLLIREVK